jgi:hypothetical protein
MGFTPAQRLRAILNAGAVIECPVTSRDVAVAESIYGPSVPGLKGRTTRTKPNEGRKIEPGADLESKELHLHADVMFINEHAFLLGVFMPIDLTVVTSLEETRNKAKLRSAVEAQLNEVEKRGFSVPVLHCDNEFKDEQVEQAISNRNMVFNEVGPGQHEPISERKVRVVKERARAVLHSLPFMLPAKLLLYLVLFVVFCLNIVPVKCGGTYISPKEVMLQRKINYKRDLRFRFGEYIQATTPNIRSNSMQARTDGDIALLSTGNVEGTIYAYNLATGRIVKRDKWTVLPIPDIVVKHLNEIAASDDPMKRVDKDPMFRIGTYVIDDDEDASVPHDEEDVASAADAWDEDDPVDELRGDDDDNDASLRIKLPRHAWRDGMQRNYNLQLDDDVVRDEDGDIVMDLSDSVDYVHTIMGRTMRECVAQQET